MGSINFLKSLIGKFIIKQNFILIFYSEAKSFIKHLLVAETSKRIGCLTGETNAIYSHKWFKNFDWKSLLLTTLPAYYIPRIR
jgi:hypothetical protein